MMESPAQPLRLTGPVRSVAALLTLVVAPGVLIGLVAADAVWCQRGTPLSARVGWASVAAFLLLIVAPAVPWTMPISLTSGASAVACLASTIAEILAGPLLAVAISSLTTDPPTPAPATAIQAGPLNDGTIHLGTDASGMSVHVSLCGEATVLVVGQPGEGKTVTLVRLIAESLRMGWAVVILDLKGSGSMKRSVRALAASCQVPLDLFDPDDPASLGYNPCAGDPAAVANALVGAFTYSGVADVYGQVGLVFVTSIVAALQAVHKPVTIEAIVDACDKDGVGRLRRWQREYVPATTADELKEDEVNRRLTYLDGLIAAGEKARVIQEGHVGIQKRLAALTQGAFGPLLRAENSLSLWSAATRPGVTYFALPALARATDVSLLGTVLVQNLKLVADGRNRQSSPVPCLVVIDETPALGEPDQLNDLLLQGREGGMVFVAAGQFLPINKALRDTLLGSPVIIAHRVAAPDAEVLAEQFGTHETSDVRVSLDYTTGQANRAMVGHRQDFTIAPNILRELPRGHAAVRRVRLPQTDRHRIVAIQREEV